MTDKIDDIVEIIAKRVTEKLQGMGITGSADPCASCTKSKDACNHCGLCVVKKPQAVQNVLNAGAARIGSNPGMTSGVDSKMAGMIDHTLLKSNATREDLLKVCDEAKKYSFATVCVNSANIPFVARQLRGTSVKPIAVVGFPLGAATAQAKAYEAREAIKAGAQEIDTVINLGALKSTDYKTVYEDIARVVEASKPHLVKVIIEASDLTHEEKITACVLSKTAGAAFVKTSTGFAKGGATVEDVALMRKIVGDDVQVKASGGIRTTEDAKAMIQAGADRIGASASVAIVTGKKSNTKGY